MKALGVLLWGTAVSGLDVQFDQSGSGPVAKVIKFLKDMSEELTADAEKDEEIFNKLKCWCQDNQREMKEDTAAAKNKIEQLTSSIENLSGKIGGLNAEIKNLDSDIAKNQKSLEEAASVHKAELASFSAEEKDMAQSISALEAAIVVLQKHQTGFIQGANQLSKVIVKHETKLGKELTKKQINEVIAFLKKPSSFLQGKANGPAASGEIFGILKNMLETFKTNLDSSRKEMASSTASYQELSESKTQELEDNQEHKGTKEQELAKAVGKKADDVESKDATMEQLGKDEQFALEVDEKCAATDDEYEQRQKTRAEEQVAVQKAIQILSSDAAFGTFSNSVGANSFIQVQAKHSQKEATVMLQKIAQKFNDPKVALIASATGLDAFTNVISMVDKLVADLKQQQQDEVDQKDWCVDEFHTNEKDGAEINDSIEGLEAEKEQHKNTLEVLQTEMDALQAEMDDAKKNIKILGSDRAQENREFQDVIIHHREANRILKHAKQVLEAYYRQNTSLLQKQDPTDARHGTTPDDFGGNFQKNGGGNVVINMIQQVIKDSELAIAEATAADSNAQKSYEKTIMDTNEMIQAKLENFETKQGQFGSTSEALLQTESSLSNKQNEKTANDNEDKDLHGRCDFLLKNFDLRQQHRTDEVEALREAKAILQGMQG